MMGLAADYGFDGLVQRVKEDDEFVRQYKLEAVPVANQLDLQPGRVAVKIGESFTTGSISATRNAAEMSRLRAVNNLNRIKELYCPYKPRPENLGLL